MDEFRVHITPVSPQIVHADDRKITYRVKMDDIPFVRNMRESLDEILELPVAFSFIEESFWPWASPDSRPFAVSVVILPAILGDVRAVFSTSSLEEERRYITRGPFRSPRVKTRIKWTGLVLGSTVQVWSASPSDGWKIDLDTVEYNFRLLFNRCWSRRSESSWFELTEHLVRVRTKTMSERMPGSTCISETTISFEEWRPDRVEGQSYTEYQEIRAGEPVVLSLKGDFTRARLSHIEIRSPMFSDELRVYRVDDLPMGFAGQYDAASQTVYVSSNYQR